MSAPATTDAAEAPPHPSRALPHGEYTQRRAVAAADAGRWGGRERWLSHARLAVFVGALALGWFVFGTRSLPALWLAPVLVAFVVLVVLHDRVIQRHRRAERRREWADAGLARLEDRWMGRGNGGERWQEPSHLYAADLDLFGAGSLFELLCTARTPAGQATLAHWLVAPADADAIRERQEAVDELRDRVDLREDLSLVGEDVVSQLDPKALLAWSSAAVGSHAPSAAIRWLPAAAVAAAGLALAAWLADLAPPIFLVLALASEAAVAIALHRRVAAVIGDVERPLRDLRLLSGLLERVEREPVSAPRLVALRAALDTDGMAPSRRIAQLQRLVDLLDARRNQFFAPFGALLLWGTWVGLALERWRAECGPHLGEWVEAAAELEALAAISGHAWENPADPFPELTDAGPLFDTVGIGHPLLPPARSVRNDVRLDGELRALVVSGSNMSGKSTLLRTVGTNAVLAMMGAPVRAEALRISPLAIAASIRVHDSLQEGRSRFYAEIQRLQQIVELTAGKRPVLFLLDEILHGTNSHDRRIGAEAVVRNLVDRDAIGLVTTHDLALARIAEDENGRFSNVHFEDHIEAGEIHFDYTLRPGVVRKSNALELMRAVGLDV